MAAWRGVSQWITLKVGESIWRWKHWQTMNYTQRNGSIHQQWIISTLINEKQCSTLGFDLCGELRRRIMSPDTSPSFEQLLKTTSSDLPSVQWFLHCTFTEKGKHPHMIQSFLKLSDMLGEAERSGLNTGHLISPLTLVLDLITARYTTDPTTSSQK